jgi:hypothetical protein
MKMLSEFPLLTIFMDNLLTGRHRQVHDTALEPWLGLHVSLLRRLIQIALAHDVVAVEH